MTATMNLMNVQYAIATPANVRQRKVVKRGDGLKMCNGLTAEQVSENPGLGFVLRSILRRYSPKVETCRIVYPIFDLGHEEVVNIGGPFNGIPHLVYATIYRNGHESCRVTAFGRVW